VALKEYEERKKTGRRKEEKETIVIATVKRFCK